VANFCQRVRRSCEQGIASAGLGMLGKVWSTGALQVVQNVAIIPQSVHPRNKLDSARPPGGLCSRAESACMALLLAVGCAAHMLTSAACCWQARSRGWCRS
jgi:hypothetical protein